MQEHWIKTLLRFAGPCRGKMVLSVLLSVASVAAGFVPFWAVYEILQAVIARTADLSLVLYWCGVGTAAYLVRGVCFGCSTVLSHISAYTILAGLRKQMADRLMQAPLGEVLGRRIGALKGIIVDKVEEIEPPLAHMIPEISANLLLPLAIVIWMLAIDWRLGLALLVAPMLSMLPLAALMKSYSSQYAGYMAANNRVNSVIVEYIEGIEVVKAFNQRTSSYEKYTSAVTGFKDFTLAWFKSTWKTMNLMLAIMPTTLLGVLPVGLWLVQGGKISAPELALGVILALSIVAPLMKVTTFINEAKAMAYAIETANSLLELPILPDSDQRQTLSHTDITLENVAFAYDGDLDKAVIKALSLSLPQGSFTALVGPSGSGKSTLARLVARFWDVGAGRIAIGGVDIRELPLAQLSELVSVVTQDNFLFDCSLLENIRLGNPAASDADVFAAARAGRPAATTSFASCLKATTHRRETRASACPAAKSSASPLPAPCSKLRR